MEYYLEWLKQVAKERFDETNTSASIPQVSTTKPAQPAMYFYNPDVKVDIANNVNYPEYEWYPGDDSVDEDVVEDFGSMSDVERYLRNPNISTQEVFDLVYKILTDEDDLPTEKALQLVGIALERFFEDLSIDKIYVIERPYQLFFSIYKYFFTTYDIPRLALAILMLYVIQHNKYRNLYLQPFASITLNNQKSLKALLSLFRYVPVENLIDVVKDDKFKDYFETYMKKLSNEPEVLELFGIDPDDFEILLPYLIEDDNTINALYKQLFNLGVGEFCKFECLMILTGTMVE